LLEPQSFHRGEYLSPHAIFGAQSDILNAMIFLLADRRGLLTKARRTCSVFSGVLSEGSLPGGFLLFCSRCCYSAVSHPQQHSIATSDTVVPMNIEVPTKYPLCHDSIVVLEIRLHSESLMLYRPALYGN